MDSSKKPSKPNPRKHANFLSQLLFVWAIPTLYKGSRKGLGQDDLTKCLKIDRSEVLGDKLEDQWFKEVTRANNKGRQPLLRNAMLRTFWTSCVVDGFICVIYIFIKSTLPAVLAQLLVQFQVPIQSNNIAVNITVTNRTSRSLADSSAGNNVLDNGDTKNGGDNINAFNSDASTTEGFMGLIAYMWGDVYSLAAILIIATLIGCFLNHHVDLRQRLLGARMRIACCSLIYRKTLRLSKKTAGTTPAGYLVNLLSNDVNRLDYGFIYIHWIWILPFQSVLICYLIWQKIGIAALVGVVGLLLKTIPVQTGLSKLSSKLRMKIAYRTDNRVGIMNEIVQGIQVIKMYAWEKPFQSVVAEARRREIKQIRYASYLRGFYLSTMVFTERSTLYITIAAAVLLGQAVTADVVFSMAQYYNILQLVAAIWYPLAVSFGAEALVSIERIQNYLMLESHDEKALGLTQKTDFSTVESNSQAILLKEVDANWDNTKGSTTLQKINIDIRKGQLCAIIGPVGAGKSSLLQLLLGELPIIDGNVLIHGDISYASQEPWLFTGTVRSNILFGETYDRKRYHDITRCCALAADFEQLPNGDKTIVGERGASLSGGQRARISLARAIYKQAAIYLFDDPLSAVDAHVGKHLFDEVIGPRSRLANEKSTRLLVTHQVHFLTEADWIVIIEDGKISRQGTYNELANSDLDFAKLLERPETEKDNESNLTDSMSVSQDLTIYEEEEIPYIDGVRGYQMLRQRASSSASSFRKSTSSDKDLTDNQEIQEDQAEGGVSGRVWKNYFLAGASVPALCVLVFVLILSQVVCSGSDYFVNIWTQQEFLRTANKPTMLTTYECLYIYGTLILLVVVMTILRGFLFFKVCMHASKVLHDRMFGSILHATMRFFDSNPSGRILNRFSKDMGAIDEFLPKAMMDFVQIALVMFGILILITIVNPILIASLAIAVLVYLLVLKIYLRPSQDLKRLEGICRSPVFSHLSASLTGISTIRARGLQDVVAREFDNLQDVHSAVWQLTMSANTALGLWLDCVSCCFLTTVAFSFIFLHNQTFSGNVGLAISQAMILTGMVQYGVRQVAESLQQMTSVERVLQYTDLEQESEIDKKPPANWPAKGEVQFKDMSLRYDPDGLPVLKHLNITIQPGWKIGVVGRTGAGKSSLIGALFRLSNIEGEIYIDGIETGTISLEILRSKISIIPQDPVLFSATIRYNLDPFGLYEDADLWRALSEVELKQAIPSLDYMVTERGSNFSVGQRQLVCLARAILRNNKVLVLDEATANVDPQTDALIQRTIRVKFKQCTVLTVAHRLHTVMDSDRILVMDAGSAKEFDIPYILLKNPNGALRQMVEATGPNDADYLKKIARDAYKSISSDN
ncbi:ATP-binding cassette sub-family C member 4 [Episyrphus balteatus]|uniref:ATP-binding cassette sub-family C member 4 n=1 Tax=Episyrphus balteatus TaxID=286459 RepID=UPI0024851FD7|nr:ATP-binding cassette sub-family C member 4 [Episyrphus balteatus]XP_055848460.1 ATP-binding cassette sub-family C member 4 [Episyrphus balteatus]XP_055848461.1 ATP-binding cassette sub-family C member 4 [Episyrphus balteatus]XP_055848462.1 ATP-binding cassette sub-family C member 4 [Episyrphus balteatus]